MPRSHARLLTSEEFSREVLNRVKTDRPDIYIRPLDNFFLLVEAESGKQRILSLFNLYQNYMGRPKEKDVLIDGFLTNMVYDQPPGIVGGFAENEFRIMPQIVPPSLMDYCRDEDRRLAAVAYVGDLNIAFVVDEPERYCYINRSVMARWGVDEHRLLNTAIRNLQAATAPGAFQQIDVGERTMFICETFDGYDASRMLLINDLVDLGAKVMGQLVVGIPHRDYMVAIGDWNAGFVQQVQESVRKEFEAHSYPITSQLYVLEGTKLVPLDGALARPDRVIN